jgi:hypothetical protein
MSNIQEFNIDTINDKPKRKVPENVDISLSVFRSGWSWKTWRGFRENIKWFFRALRPAWHRATKGYCRMDTWNVDTSLTMYMVKVLTEYRNVTNGSPMLEEFSTFEDWIAAIDECIDLLLFTLEEVDTQELYLEQCEAREKAFAWLGKYLPHIWW